MQDAPITTPPGIDTRLPHSPRLQLKPEVPTTSYVDGGWWPRSTSLPIELPLLLSSLARIIDHIALVGYHVHAWDRAPDYVEIGDDNVLLQAFTADDPHSVVIVSGSGQRLTLLVVAPDTSEFEAQLALSSAAASVAAVTSNVENESAADRSLGDVVSRLSLLHGLTDDAHRATVKGWVGEAAQQFTHAPIQSYVPILVEHIVRGRIAAAARGAEN